MDSFDEDYVEADQKVKVPLLFVAQIVSDRIGDVDVIWRVLKQLPSDATAHHRLLIMINHRLDAVKRRLVERLETLRSTNVKRQISFFPKASEDLEPLCCSLPRAAILGASRRIG